MLIIFLWKLNYHLSVLTFIKRIICYDTLKSHPFLTLTRGETKKLKTTILEITLATRYCPDPNGVYFSPSMKYISINPLFFAGCLPRKLQLNLSFTNS